MKLKKSELVKIAKELNIDPSYTKRELCNELLLLTLLLKKKCKEASLSDLQELARENGLYTGGTKEEIRKRLLRYEEKKLEN
jgi:hypothetical protein